MDGAVTRHVTVLALVLAAWSWTASAQSTPSLADVARQEEARRSQTRKPARVLTNADLSAGPNAVEKPATAKETPAATAKPTETPASADMAKTDAAPAKTEESEKVWRARADRLQSTLDAARAAVAAASKPSPSDDPREQAMLAKVLNTAKKQLEDAEQQWRLFEMQADVARVPKAWILPKS